MTAFLRHQNGVDPIKITLFTAACLLPALLLEAGCDGKNMQHEAIFVEDSSVREKLISFSQNGSSVKTVPIRDFTTFEWDEVCRHTSAFFDRLELKAGDTLTREFSRMSDHGSMMVFFYRGKRFHFYAARLLWLWKEALLYTNRSSCRIQNSQQAWFQGMNK